MDCPPLLLLLQSPSLFHALTHSLTHFLVSYFRHYFIYVHAPSIYFPRVSIGHLNTCYNLFLLSFRVLIVVCNNSLLSIGSFSDLTSWRGRPSSSSPSFYIYSTLSTTHLSINGQLTHFSYIFQPTIFHQSIFFYLYLSSRTFSHTLPWTGYHLPVMYNYNTHTWVIPQRTSEALTTCAPLLRSHAHALFFHFFLTSSVFSFPGRSLTLYHSMSFLFCYSLLSLCNYSSSVNQHYFLTFIHDQMM